MSPSGRLQQFTRILNERPLTDRADRQYKRSRGDVTDRLLRWQNRSPDRLISEYDLLLLVTQYR